jgi:16S rRNA (adenine1518-N6/adenine1519-N6)-dimethyltransferase
MTKLEELKAVLQSKNLWAKKSLGQNFLIDERALNTIISAANLQKTDHVIEVGPGTGFLTEKLLAKAGQVTAVELDKDMCGVLEERFGGSANFDLVNEDILKFDFNDARRRDVDVAPSGKSNYKVIANIPYYITSPLLKKFLQSESPPSLMVLLVQKEVAEKVCGITGKSLITIETQLFGKPEVVDNVPASSFYPAPKVDSAILKIEVHPKPLVPADQLKDFLRIVKFGFSQKRKKLANSLGAGVHKKPAEMREILTAAGIDPEVRAEGLTIEDWRQLLAIIKEARRSS